MIHVPENFTLYAILLNKTDEKPLSKEIIGRHISHLRELDRDGRLVLCGPFADHPSGMVVIRAADRGEATEIAKKDPFVQEGVRAFEVRTWMIACAENGYLG